MSVVLLGKIYCYNRGISYHLETLRVWPVRLSYHIPGLLPIHNYEPQ